MESKSSHVALGEDKWLGILLVIPHVGKVMSAISNLVEQAEETLRVCGRASTTLNLADWVRHVRLVIGGVGVHAIPA
jgi:hypothetical protein